METRAGQPMSQSNDIMAPIQGSSSNEESSKEWSEGRKRFLHHHQEKYLKRLTQFRETLLKEKDLVKRSLPKSCEKSTGFWEVIMADLQESSSSHNFAGMKSQRAHHSSVGGMFSTDLNRRGHLERLRRIRIMQTRRKLPPQLEPLHGIGLTSRRRTENTPVAHAKPLRVQPTAYHVRWLRGNNLVTPMAEEESDVGAWTLKQMKLLETEIGYENASHHLYNDDGKRWRKTHPSDGGNMNPEHTVPEDRTHSNASHSDSSTHSHQTKARTRSNRSIICNRPPDSDQSIPPLKIESLTHPSRESSHSECATEIVSHNSSNSSPEYTAEKNLTDNTVRASAGASERPKYVDRACSPVGFRLPPLEASSRTSVSSSANSKRQIIVKVPDGIE